MNGGRGSAKTRLRSVFTHLGSDPGARGESGEGSEERLTSELGVRAASWIEGSCRSCAQAEGVARRAQAGGRAGGDPDGLSHFLLGFLTSRARGRSRRGVDAKSVGGAGVRSRAVASTHTARAGRS